MARCESCDAEAKYTCPACGAKSCSLECCSAHKAAAGCSGVLDPARFVPKGELLTPTGLDRDYNFLQRLGRDIELEKPDFCKRGRDVARNGVKIRAMPPGMSRAKKNRSGWNRREQRFYWTVGVQATVRDPETLVYVPDSTVVADLAKLADLDLDLGSYRLKDADGRLIPIRGDQTLAEALSGQCVAEFPTVVLDHSDSSGSDSDSDSSGSDSDSSDSDSDSEGSDSDELVHKAPHSPGSAPTDAAPAPVHSSDTAPTHTVDPPKADADTLDPPTAATDTAHADLPDASDSDAPIEEPAKPEPSPKPLIVEIETSIETSST